MRKKNTKNKEQQRKTNIERTTSDNQMPHAKEKETIPKERRVKPTNRKTKRQADRQTDIHEPERCEHATGGPVSLERRRAGRDESYRHTNKQ